MKSRELVEEILAGILARILYFVGTFLFVLFGLLYGGRRHGGWLLHSGPDEGQLALVVYLLIPLAIALLAAIVGPTIYSQAVNRGRGSLGEIRDASKRKP